MNSIFPYKVNLHEAQRETRDTNGTNYMLKKRQIAPGIAVTTGRHLYSIPHLRVLQLLFWDA